MACACRVILDIGRQIEIDLEAMKKARHFYNNGENADGRWKERFHAEMDHRGREYAQTWRVWGCAAVGIGIDDGWSIREVPRLDSCRVDKYYKDPSGETANSLKQVQALKRKGKPPPRGVPGGTRQQTSKGGRVNPRGVYSDRRMLTES